MKPDISLLNRHSLVSSTIAVLVMSIGGCTSTQPTPPPSKPVPLPEHAAPVEDGLKDLSYIAKSDGTVYIFDTDDQKLLYMGQLNLGEKVEVNAETDTLSIKGKELKAYGLQAGHRYRIYFVKSS